MENENTNVNNENVTAPNNNQNVAEMFKAKKRNDKIKRYLKKGLLVVGVLLLLAFCSSQKPPEAPKEFNFDEVAVSRGDVEVTIAGDGVIEANSIYTITPKVTGEILEDYVEVDQYVQKGDLLYVIDSKDVKTSINQASIAVEQSNNSVNQANIAAEQSNVSLEQAKLNYNNIQKQIEDLNIYSPSTGYIHNLRVDRGSAVSNMMEVCDISEKDAYEVTLEFRTSNVKDITIGNRASLFFLDHFSYVDGYVSKISDSTHLLEQGSQVTNITIRVDTTGYSIQNARVEGIIYLNSGLELRSVNQGLVGAVSNSPVVSNSTGTVKEKYVDEGTYVQKGDLLLVLENSTLQTQLDNAEMSIKSAEMGIKNAQVTIKNAENSKKSAQNSLSQTRQQLDNYNITSPISGKIVYKNAQKGDVISTYKIANSNILATIADVSVLKFDVSIDELDITKIKVGQDVIVSVEALDNKEFAGKVANINTIGVNAAGTTNYTVVIEVPGTDEIYSGMTVDAEIKVAKRENVLRVPLTAVRKDSVVYVKVNDELYQDEDEKVPQGYKKVPVEVGLNGKNYVEIVSGLSSGDIVLTDKIKESGTFSMQNLANMMREN